MADLCRIVYLMIYAWILMPTHFIITDKNEGITSPMNTYIERVNPWLLIPATDYEGHMEAPNVGQLQFLSRVFKDALQEYGPRSVAVLGCATGNGFEHVDPDITKHVMGVDINPDYLNVAKDRYAERIPGLQLICGDLMDCSLDNGSYDLIYGGLVFEYVDPAPLIEKAARWLAPGGILVVVLQLPAKSSGKVSDTPFRSLRLLDSIMELVEPGYLKAVMNQVGLIETGNSIERLASSKPFFIGHYRRSAE